MDIRECGTLDFDPDLADGAFRCIDREGKVHCLPGIEGYRLMEILRECDMPVPATCGGAAACGTCHVYVAPEWAGKLPVANEEEEARLDELLHVGPGSRLSCQIIWQQAVLDGLTVTLAPLEE